MRNYKRLDGRGKAQFLSCQGLIILINGVKRTFKTRFLLIINVYNLVKGY